MKLLGLPGLYQNWLMTSLDPGCDFFQFENNINFEYRGKNIQFLLMRDRPYNQNTDSIIINLYVKPKNIVWYLYNFLEKTDYVGIQVKNLHKQLFTKAPGTIAFDTLLKHFKESYKITANSNKTYIKNAMIEYFYFMLAKQNEFTYLLGLTDERFINIEYEDFSDLSILVNKLQHLPGFDLTHFKKMYKILQDTNKVYLDKKKNFAKRINSTDLDILEIAYLGSQIDANLDWFNEEVRETVLKEKLFVQT